MIALGYSPEKAAAAFDPPLSGKQIRKAINDGALVVHRVGTHAVILPEDLMAWVRSMPEYNRRTNNG
jgi:hypothetical protein